VGGCRRELLDQVIPLNEEHLRRLVGEYISYFHEDRIHDGLGKDNAPSPADSDQARFGSEGAFESALGRSPSSLFLAASCIVFGADSSSPRFCRRPQRQVLASHHWSRRAVTQIRGRYRSPVPQLGETPTVEPLTIRSPLRHDLPTDDLVLTTHKGLSMAFAADDCGTGIAPVEHVV
jgi:hypothetical protein